jgi:hypothetical protein
VSKRLVCRPEFVENFNRALSDPDDYQSYVGGIHGFFGIPIVEDPDLPENIRWRITSEHGEILQECIEFEGRLYNVNHEEIRKSYGW